MPQEFIDYFGEFNGLDPELFLKYIIFVTALAGLCRLIGELFNSVR